MDEEGIALVLARASELRSKITNCIHRASITEQTEDNIKPQEQGEEDKDNGSLSKDKVREAEEVREEEEEEAEILLNIRDALESLEAQLSSLQALQQQQWYEREAALAEIDYSRKKLLMKLKEYNGEDLEVIHEAAAFASETVEDNNDLLLPPYPTRPSHSVVSDNGYLSRFPSARKLAHNGLISDDTKIQTKALHVSLKNQVRSKSHNPPKGLRPFINAAAKTVLTLVGAISILALAGFEPKLRKRDTHIKIFGLFQQQGAEAERKMDQCPPGKVLVVEDGEARCLVKERVEIPFESVVAAPDVNYGCG
ncbi:Plastid division protein [Actinidia chinensis var. chinensis]|uniref:Plastid division protein n=1 Tax=Actinidia chinensis var. chinensis TaxID=1590841 RepID=A0A2R6RH97_ACTCC|nr:Plastid division protein [Actinidia chinensis var. chinensis]